jgi:DNA-binding NarL/FixJ family response regulator
VLGYLVSGCSLGELEGAVHAACRGHRFLCQAAAREVANSLTSETLTLRERDVLGLLAQGCCNKTIASGLDIALGTVKAHVRSIMAKLDASSRTEAASVAAARGLLPEPAFAPTGAMRAPPLRTRVAGLPRVGISA